MEKIIGIISLIIGIANIVLLYIYIRKVNKYQKMYESSLAKFNSTENIKDTFQGLFEKLDSVSNEYSSIQERCNELSKRIDSNISKTGLIRYNAYNESDNKLSFSLAMLNCNNDGLLVNYIHSIHGSNIYIKQVTNGKVKDRISEEEAKAIEEAMVEKNNLEESLMEVKKVDIRAINRLKR